jgi:hypothetical protein
VDFCWVGQEAIIMLIRMENEDARLLKSPVLRGFIVQHRWIGGLGVA